MSSEQEAFSVGRVATFCDVTRSTISNWVKEKRLNSFKLPSGHLRIERASLIEFMRQYNMPLPPELKKANKKILILTRDDELVDFLRRSLNNRWEEPVQIEVSGDVLEACFTLGVTEPDIFAVDGRIKLLALGELAVLLAQEPRFDRIVKLLFSGYHEDLSMEQQGVLGKVLSRPWSGDELNLRLQELMND